MVQTYSLHVLYVLFCSGLYSIRGTTVLYCSYMFIVLYILYATNDIDFDVIRNYVCT
jgi:hypothetical protein